MTQLPAAGAAQAVTLRCFLVEDSALIRANLIATLEEMLPLTVLAWAEDEASAVRWMAESGATCNLMVIDIFLKSGTGLEVLRHASALCPHAQRVVLTNYATAEIRSRCAELGAHRVFDKSAELEELLDYCAQLGAQTGAQAGTQAGTQAGADASPDR